MLFLTKITELFTAFERIFCALYFTLPLLNTAVVSCSVVNLRFAIVRLIRWTRCALYLVSIVSIFTLLILLLLCNLRTQFNNLLLVILLALTFCSIVFGIPHCFCNGLFATELSHRTIDRHSSHNRGQYRFSPCFRSRRTAP